MSPIVRACEDGDREAVVALWRACDLVVPWNDPEADIALCRSKPETATLLVGHCDGRVVASVMVGQDGHRGWLYYLACAPDCRGRGFGRAMVAAAEAWLAIRGMPKAHLLVRETARVLRTARLHPLPRHHDAEMARTFSLTPRAAKPAGPHPGELQVIITFLEMAAPPVHAPLPQPPGELALVRATPPTVSFYRYLYNTVGEPWLWHERRRLGDAALAEAVSDPRVEVQVLYVAGTPAGYIEIDRRKARATDIAYFGLVPDFIGMRLGPWLLDRGIRMAWQGGASALTVNTCTFDHPKALPLYQSMGFVPKRHVTRTVRDPRADGVLPRTVAPHVPMTV